jgi:hypothetical protein
MMTIPPQTRRANRWLLLGLVVFAVSLCALVLWWMRVTVRAKGGIVDPQARHTMHAPASRTAHSILSMGRRIVFVAPIGSLPLASRVRGRLA